MHWVTKVVRSKRQAGRVWPRRIGTSVALSLMLAGGAWWWVRPPPGVTRELAGLVTDLQHQPAIYQRLATASARKFPPVVRRLLPDFLNTDSADRRRLEACHRLLALGPETRPVVPQLVRAFSDPDSTVAFYAFLVLVHSATSPSEVVTRARSAWGSGSGPANFYAGLLTTEDERIRDFAWKCLEASGDDALVAATSLHNLVREGEPELRNRAAALLRRLEPRPDDPPESGILGD